MAIDRNNPQFRFVTDRNLLRQFDLLQQTVELAITEPSFRVTGELIRQLNAYAVIFLSDTAGQYRDGPIYISNSIHVPPPAPEVPKHMEDLLRYLRENWTERDAVHLAAYALWALDLDTSL